MAKEYDRFAIGSPAPESGRYEHASCGYADSFIKGTALAACGNTRCSDPGGYWVLTKLDPQLVKNVRT